MKSNEFDSLLSGLLGSKPDAPSATEQEKEQKSSAASEQSRRRVEEIMKHVELETDRKRELEKQTPKPQPQPLPKREPVVVPPPISHFSEEPSQNPAVRMRDRLEETALPMIDNDRKPNQIIPPKPKAEAKPKKKKSHVRTVTSTDIPAPPRPPKRTVPHIEVPDEFPPDVPSQEQATAAEEERRKKLEAIRQAVREQRSTRPETGVQQPEPEFDDAEPTRIMRGKAEAEIPVQMPEEETVPEEISAAVNAEMPVQEMTEQPAEIAGEASAAQDEFEEKRRQELAEKLKKIKQKIRLAAEEVQAIPEPEEPAQTEEPIAEEEPSVTEETVSEEEIPVVEEIVSEDEPLAEEEPIVLEEPVTNEAQEESEAVEEIAAPQQEEIAETPRLRHLSVPAEPEKKRGIFSPFRKKQKDEKVENLSDKVQTQEPVPMEEPEEAAVFAEETEAPTEPETTDEPIEDAISETETDDTPEISEDMQDSEETAVPEAQEKPSIDVSLPEAEQKARKRSTFSAAIREALDENAKELEDVKAEQLPQDDGIDVAVGKSRKNKRGYFVVGVICTIFAVIGLVVCVMQAVQAIRSFMGNSSLSRQIEDVLYPAVIMDLPEFDDPANTEPELLMSAAVMDLLMYGDLSAYNEVFDVISIPGQDVKKRAEEMFGIALPEEYTTLFAAGELFFYDESTQCYNVPSSPVIFSYAPDVQDIKRVENVYTVTVAYRADSAQWQQRSVNYKKQSDKIMEITLFKDGDTFRIIRIANVSKHTSGI